MYAFFKRTSVTMGLMAALFGITMLSTIDSASAATVNWQAEGPITDINNANFDNGEITFTGFQASALDSIDGSAGYHGHGSPVTLTMDFRLNGMWTNVFSTFTGNTRNITTFSSLAVPILFTNSIIDGIRFGSSQAVNQAFHSFLNDVNFNFNTVTPLSAVPLPAGLPLYGAGLAVLGFIGWRRKQRHTNT